LKFGFGGFWYGLLRLASNIGAAVERLKESDHLDLVTLLKGGGEDLLDNPFIYWWFSRASPLTGTIRELINQKDFLGYPIETPEDYMKFIMSKFEPIWMEQGLNWMIPGYARDNEIPEGIAKVALPIAEIFGLRSFPDSAWNIFYDKAKEYIQRIPESELDEKQLEAWRNGTLSWKQLNELQKLNLLTKYEDLDKLYETAQEDSQLRNSDLWKRYQEKIETERTNYYARLDELVKQVRAGEIDMATFREKVGEAGQNYGAILDSMQEDPAYADIYALFDAKDVDGTKYGFRDDEALAEYESKILYADDLTLPNGDFDWDERDERIDEFITKWGRPMYDRIQEYLNTSKELKGLNPVIIQKGKDSQKLNEEYWDLPYKPIAEIMDEAEVPAEYLDRWKQLQTLTGEDRAAFLRDNTDLAKDWRAEYRLNNPEVDAILAVWGYGGKVQSMEAYELAEKMASDLGIPFEITGLPPRNLAPSYFEYNKLVTDFSAGSAEAKLYRLDNPEWDEWGQANLGWKPIDDDTDKLRLSVEWKEKWLDIDAEYKALPKAGYDQEWYLMEHTDFLKVATEYYGWQEKDFSKIPTKEVWGLYQEYEKLPVGDERMKYRIEHPELDAWLVLAKGYKPAAETEGEETTQTEETSEEPAEESSDSLEDFKKKAQEIQDKLDALQ
jgi:hypothetical protein